MDGEKEIDRLAEEFQSFQKVLTARIPKHDDWGES